MPISFEGPKAEVETAKQIITLASGVIAFTVTFLDKFRPKEMVAVSLPWQLYLSWGLLSLSVGFALWYLMALNGTIAALAKRENGWILTDAETLAAGGDSSHSRLPGILMIATFFFAVLALIWVGLVLGIGAGPGPRATCG